MQLDERPLDQESTVASARFFDRTGPGTPAGQYLRRFWIPVALLGDVAPGRAKTVQIMSEQFTYYRGETGTPHLVASECAHRHTRLAPHGIVEGECIRCFYHGWKYEASGQCIEQPAEGPHNFANKVQIKAFPVREDLGLVFAYFGPDDPPAFQEIDVFHGPGVRDTTSYFRGSNFFNSLDNHADWVHENFVHKRSQFTTNGVNREIPVVTAKETDFGVTGYLTYSDGIVGVNYVLMPIAMYILGSSSQSTKEHGVIWVHQIAWRVPIDDNSHRSFNVHYADITGVGAELYRKERQIARESAKALPSRQGIIDAIYRGEIHIDEVDEKRPDIVNIQDTITLESQDLISEREPDRLGRSDAAVIVLRKIYMREIRKMLAKEPMIEWTWPKGLRAVPQIAAP